MKIVNYEYPHSSFLSIEKDMEIITNKILKNERLKRLLYYTTNDALDRKPIGEDASLELFGKNIKIVPKLYIDGSVLNYIVISFDNFTPNATNPEYRNNTIASDIVPINGENRILAYYGLKQLNMSPCVGMKSIIDVCGLTDKEISVSDIVFKIGPRLNASGRLQSAKEAVKLLIIPEESTADRITLEKMAEKIDQYNLDRKKLDKNITEEATEELENADDFNMQSSIVVYNPNWHKGVVGIVASRLTERYYKPTIVLTHSNGCATGSGRSVQGFDIYKAIESCRDLLENFGGHMYAVGLSMKEENVPEFQRRFEKYVSENLSEEQRLPQIDIDACIDFCDITPKFFRLLKQFSPYGPENMKPIFVTRRTFDYGTSKVVGKEQEHLKLELIDSKSECIMNGIAFGMSEFNDYIKSLNPVDICYSIEENTFNGNTTIQLVIKDIKKSTT